MEEWIKKSDAIKAIKDHSFALGDDYMERVKGADDE